MHIAIIIPSLNSPIIDRVLDAIHEQAQIEEVDEILIVGRDELGLIESNARVRFIDSGVPIKASVARNLGIAHTRADLLIFLDSDCLPEPGWLTQILMAHAAGHPVVGGGVLPDGGNYWQLVYNLTLFHEVLTIAEEGSRDYLPTLNISVKRMVVDIVGGMDDRIDRVEDIDWTTRIRAAGIQPNFWPRAAVYHEHNRTTLRQVWYDCAHSGFHMQWLRLRHKGMLQAPVLLKYKWLVLLLSPLIAAWATFRIVWKNPTIFCRYFYTLPAIYLSKIGWCWGASRQHPIK